METDRIKLRRWRESDAATLFRYASDPEVGPKAGWPAHKSEQESLSVIRNIFSNDRTWAIELKESGEAIGCICYYTCRESNIGIGKNDAEIGYWIARPYWNMGICTDALRLVVRYCFEVKGAGTLWCDFLEDNPASGRVLEKCGFMESGRTNLSSCLNHGGGQPVKVMRLDRPQ